MSQKQVIIVGGGASGLMAGIFAGVFGASVTILEHNDRPGKKLCATGNGRCNLTNLHMPDDAYRGEHPDFAWNIIRQFPVEDTLHIFEDMGLSTTDRDGFVYPRSMQARAVADILCMEAGYNGVRIKNNEHVQTVVPDQDGWSVRTDSWTYKGDAVILANGSRASSISGADGSGYELAKRLGHRIVRPLPALTALKCAGDFSGNWAGVRCAGEVSLFVDGMFQKKERGELQLTEYGISGIPVFSLSRYAVRALDEKHTVTLEINFFPEFSDEEYQYLLKKRRTDCPYKNNRELLIGLLPEKLAKIAGSRPDMEKILRAWPLTVKSGLPYTQAQVCSGGVATDQVDPATLESRLHRGLFFAGELLDIDGTCGGYNLQWAWSSGAVAGIHAAKEER